MQGTEGASSTSVAKRPSKALSGPVQRLLRDHCPFILSYLLIAEFVPNGSEILVRGGQ